MSSQGRPVYGGDLNDLIGLPMWDWQDDETREIVRREVAWLPPDFDLKYDDMFIGGRQLLLGEAKHFAWRVEQIARNEACRRVAREHIEREARRILGEPLPSSG